MQLNEDIVKQLVKEWGWGEVKGLVVCLDLSEGRLHRRDFGCFKRNNVLKKLIWIPKISEDFKGFPVNSNDHRISGDFRKFLERITNNFLHEIKENLWKFQDFKRTSWDFQRSLPEVALMVYMFFVINKTIKNKLLKTVFSFIPKSEKISSNKSLTKRDFMFDMRM